VLVVKQQPMTWGRKTNPEYCIVTVPLASVRMLWKRYLRERVAAQEAIRRAYVAREAAYEAKLVAQKDAAAFAAKLNGKLEGTPFKARISDGVVVITGARQDMLELVELVLSSWVSKT
jgi:hypothetical protein